MKSASKKVTKKSRGRPATGTGIQVGERWSLEAIAAIDYWRRGQTDLPGRPEAIRRLVEIALALSTEVRPKTESQRQHARDMASEAIDKMADKAASSDEQASRKRRLVKGPEEFQKLRRDRDRK